MMRFVIPKFDLKTLSIQNIRLDFNVAQPGLKLCYHYCVQKLKNLTIWSIQIFTNNYKDCFIIKD